MPDQRDILEQTPTSERGIEQPQAISLEVAATIAGEVRDLIQAGEEQSAWERLRNLHPADMGSIVASPPRTSRDAMVRAMSPDTVAWMLRQMNPVEAGTVGVRLGAGVLSFMIDQVNPQQALETLAVSPSRAPEKCPKPWNVHCRTRTSFSTRPARLGPSWSQSSPRSISTIEPGQLVIASGHWMIWRVSSPTSSSEMTTTSLEAKSTWWT